MLISTGSLSDLWRRPIFARKGFLAAGWPISIRRLPDKNCSATRSKITEPDINHRHHCSGSQAGAGLAPARSPTTPATISCCQNHWAMESHPRLVVTRQIHFGTLSGIPCVSGRCTGSAGG